MLSFDPPGGQSFYSLDRRIIRIELGVGSTNARLTVLNALPRIVALRASVCAHAPDVVIGFMHSMFIPLGLALVGTSIPLIASEHIEQKYYRSRPVEALLLRLIPLLAKRVTCVSEQVLHSFSPSLQRKMVTVPNPVNVRAHGRADASGSQKPHKLLLTVGRLEPQKDYATLIHAFAKIVDRVPDWILRIVGEGGLRKQLEVQISALGLNGRVELVGATKDVFKEYMAAQLFVSSSRYESFGLTTAEALAHGLPSVGFADCLGINQLIRPGENGALVEGNGDRDNALAAVLEAMMRDDGTRISLSKSIHGLPAEYILDNVLGRNF